MAKKNHKIASLKQVSHHFLKSRTLFIFLALTFLFFLGYAAISNLVFLGKQINNAINIDIGTNSAKKFDIEGFEKLKLIR